MNVGKIFSSLLVALCSVLLGNVSVASAAAVAPVKTAADTQATKIVDAANAFLTTLSAAQKKAVLFNWTDDVQRAHWSPLPEGVFNRSGLRRGELNAVQRSALMELLGTVLSADGLELVKNQMNADDIWKSTGGTLNVPPSAAVLAFSTDQPPIGAPSGRLPPAGGPRSGCRSGRPLGSF